MTMSTWKKVKICSKVEEIPVCCSSESQGQKFFCGLTVTLTFDLNTKTKNYGMVGWLALKVNNTCLVSLVFSL